MPSRKKNKGKERKAKKAELEAEKSALEVETIRALVHETWTGYARGIGMDGRKLITLCNHGGDLIPDNNHPVTSFMDSFYRNGAVNSMNIIDNSKDLFEAHREVWYNENYRQMAINIFIAIGTNFMLQKDIAEDASNIANTNQEAHAIVLLENYDDSGDFDSVIYNRVAAAKMRDFNGDNSTFSLRDELKFYRKRATCSCLKKMHLEARKCLPKLGMCFHCGVVKERALLMVCSRCRVSQYCSRECQVSDWAQHKIKECDDCAFFQKQQTKKS